MNAVDLGLLVAAPFVGSFAALCADRIAEDRSVILGRSGCQHCGRRLSTVELVPVLSWLMLRGKSRCCKKTLPADLIVAEVLFLAVTVWALATVPGVMGWVTVGLGWALLLLCVIDLRVQRLPDWVTLPLVVAGLCLSLSGATGPPLMHAVGAVAGYALFALTGAVYFWWRGFDGLGLGDAKLLAAAGAWLGITSLPSVLVIGCAAGLGHAGAIGLARSGLNARLAVPFGPSLSLGFWITWVYGPIAVG